MFIKSRRDFMLQGLIPHKVDCDSAPGEYGLADHVFRVWLIKSDYTAVNSLRNCKATFSFLLSIWTIYMIVLFVKKEKNVEIGNKKN